MKKILVLKGPSRYNVLRVAADEVINGFREKGYEVVVCNLEDEEGRKNFSNLMLETYSFIFSLQALAFDFYVKGVPLLTYLKSPYIGWIFDDYMYHEDRVSNAKYDHVSLLSIDQEQCQLILDNHPECKNIFCLHHGGFEAPELPTKDIDILFPANLGTKPDLNTTFPDQQDAKYFLANQAIEILSQKPQLSPREALTLVVEELGEKMTPKLLHALGEVVVFLDCFVRYECRYNTLMTLLESGKHIHLIGDGYNIDEKYRNQITYYGGMDITEVVKLFARAKIVINPIPTYRQGLHERLLTALLNKAIIFTPYQPYLDENYTGRFQLYDMNNLDNIISEIDYILNNPDDIRNYIEDNYNYAKLNHTWKKRGEEIIDFYEDFYK